ncbi:MAG: HD domain-containing protein, partial [bacterium]
MNVDTKKFAIFIFGFVFILNIAPSVFSMREAIPSSSPQKYCSTSIFIKTLYGTFEIDDHLVLELLNCSTMQRLKKVHQYGVRSYITGHGLQYTRYDHSVGVWALLKRFKASRKEQIAGLLHDVSHTVFSHVGDFVFRKKERKDAYQDDIHENFLKQTPIPNILKLHGLELADVLNTEGRFKMLDQEYPDLCIDRLEYNLQGGLLKGLLTKNDIEVILNDIVFKNGQWYFCSPEVAHKFARVSIDLMVGEWGSPEYCLIYP